MAAGFARVTGESRRYPSSSSSSHSGRFENHRTTVPQILCRNGPQCRKFQERTCNYNHDFTSLAPNIPANQKKSLNADSPAFTPKLPTAQPVKSAGISPKAAAAATFTPRGSGTATPAGASHSKEPSLDYNSAQPVFQPSKAFSEFVPGQNFVPQQQNEAQATIQSQLSGYSDTFLPPQVAQGITALENGPGQLNPYAQTTPAVSGQAFFPDASAFKHPLSYHLYASIGPQREKSHPYQRSTSDFFISDELREDLQRKSEAALQTFLNSTLPQAVEYFHSLVALDTTAQKGHTAFGLPSSVYKAISAKDGRTYALRRIEGFRITNEAAITTIKSWKRINNGSIVRVYDAFTGRWFGDSSLIVVTDYHPLAQTAAEKFMPSNRANHNVRSGSQIMSEEDVWSYIVQIANALRTIHEMGLAAQILQPSKVLVTGKNRLRLNCCGILDMLRFDQKRPLHELQRADLQDFGGLILCMMTRDLHATENLEKSLLMLSRSYSERLRACITWLLSPPASDNDATGSRTTDSTYNIGNLLGNIADKIMSTMDSEMHHVDAQGDELMRELENARLVRLLTKLNVILERPDSSLSRTGTAPSSTSSSSLNQASAAWSETGDRYYLKLFRDYVFHQVDGDGRPVLNLGHIIVCLNKLDAGIDERVHLVSRDEQNSFVLTYRDLKRGFESAWTEISKSATGNGRR